MTVKTIDIQALEWFDRINGNSYFAGEVTINYGMDGQETFYMPFQYGYGSQSEFEALQTLKDAGLVNSRYSSQLSAQGITVNYNKRAKCLKRQLNEYTHLHKMDEKRRAS